jgi:hypothetical protein
MSGSGSQSRVRIDGSWTIAADVTADRVIATAAQDLAAFCLSRCGLRLPIVEPSVTGAPDKRIRLQVAADPEAQGLNQPESFVLVIGGGGVDVIGMDLRGLLYGVFHLEDLIDVDGVEGLETGTVRRQPVLPIRIGEDSQLRFRDEDLRFLAQSGVNCLYYYLEPWMEQLTPSDLLPHDRENIFWNQNKIDSINDIFERAQNWALDCYLYVRGLKPISGFSGGAATSMRPFIPDVGKELFARHPEVRGSHSGLYSFLDYGDPFCEDSYRTPESLKDPFEFEGYNLGGLYSNRYHDHKRDVPYCFSSGVYRRFLEETCKNLFRHIPLLKGLIVVPADMTLWCDDTCSSCRGKSLSSRWAEYIRLLHSAARSERPDAQIVVYVWAWKHSRRFRDEVFNTLPQDVVQLLISIEGADHMIEGKNYRRIVNADASIAVTALGVMFKGDVATAKSNGQRCITLEAFCRNNDFSYVPYVPAPYRIIEKIRDIQDLGLSGWMSLDGGGLNPGTTMEVVKWGIWEPADRLEGAVQRMAARDYGDAAAPAVLRAWRIFSEAVKRMPTGAYYIGPMLGRAPRYPIVVSPDALTYFKQVCDYPYERPSAWVHGRQEVLQETIHYFKVVEAEFTRGIEELISALGNLAEESQRTRLGQEILVSKACRIQLRSEANILDFVLQLRVEPASLVRQLDIIRRELENCREFLVILQEADTRELGIGFNPFWGRMFTVEDIERKIRIMEQQLAKYAR